jgi:hypothetical protein
MAAYTPPASPDFNFTEGGYTPPADSLEADFDFIPAGVYLILAGTSVNFTSIWAEPTADISTGRFQVASRGTGAALSIINIDSSALYDYYTTTVSGRAGEALDSNKTADLVTI